MPLPMPSSLGIEVVSTGRKTGSKGPSTCWELAKSSLVTQLEESLLRWDQKDEAVDPDSFKGRNFKPKMVQQKKCYELFLKCRGRAVELEPGIAKIVLANDADIKKQLEAWKAYFEALNKGDDEIAEQIHKISIAVSKPKTGDAKQYNPSTDMYEKKM